MTVPARMVFATVAAAAAAVVTLAGPAGAATARGHHPRFDGDGGRAVFVQTDNPAGNQIAVYRRSGSGTLSLAGTYATGGLGGVLVHPSGRLTAHPVVNPEPGTVPFAISFDRAGHLVIAEAGTNALATYGMNGDGSVSLIDRVGTGQAATCWVTPARGTLYASNDGSASLSGYRASDSGQLTLLGQTSTGPGTVDAAAPGGGFLYTACGGRSLRKPAHTPMRQR